MYTKNIVAAVVNFEWMLYVFMVWSDQLIVENLLHRIVGIGGVPGFRIPYIGATDFIYNFLQTYYMQKCSRFKANFTIEIHINSFHSYGHPKIIFLKI